MIGKVINKYRIEKILGEGGMGVVYLGWDLELERLVAVKEIKSSLPGYDKYIERLKKEAKVLARLNHPNIVILYDLIQYQNNWYIVMEYVEGVTLDKKVEQIGALPHQEAAPIFKQMLAAVDHAHQAGITHRDLKPGNVMIKFDGQVKVMDFGLAKIQTSAGATHSTKTEHTGGTLYYLSPEQVEGKPVDLRSDIYSLGMACYEALAGYMPLKEKKTTVEILNAILRDNFPLPTKFNAAVPKELSKIVRKAIALKPGKRFQNAGEMLAEVEKFEAEQEKNEDPAAVKRRRIRLTIEIVWGVITIALVLTLITVFAVPDLPLRILKWAGILSPTKVAIYTEPAGAKIEIGGKPVGKSPLRSRFVNVDTMRVSIQESTYFGIDTSIVLKEVTDTTLIFILKPAATFAIAVVPESAVVMIDGKIISPAERGHIELAVGEHGLRITGDGYVTMDEKNFLRQGPNPPQSYTLKQARIAALSTPASKDKQKNSETKAVLEDTVVTDSTSSSSVETPPRTGILTLAIDPPSEVYIGDSLAAKTSTQYDFTLPFKTYTFKVVHPTLGRWAETITIGEQRAFREIDFTKKYTITVLAFDLTDKPLGANIYLDDRPTGQYTPDNLSLNFGHHAIEVRLEGYEIDRRELNVEKNDKLIFKLKRLQ
ncbi:protein kinase [candidate division KSB1 bacterium]|nr:protein kinase [candidate division KSB1 bacterium]